MVVEEHLVTCELPVATFFNEGTIQKTTKKLRVNIVLNHTEDAMHDTTNTCSCDSGVRSQFEVPRFQFFGVESFYFFGFQVFSFHLGMRT